MKTAIGGHSEELRSYRVKAIQWTLPRNYIYKRQLATLFPDRGPWRT